MITASYKYDTIAVGGTFDHIHKGHRALLKRAFETGRKVFIGVTADDFAADSGKKIVYNFDQRKKQLLEYLASRYPERHYVITKLEKSFGPGIFTSEINAIVVSDETAPRVTEANRRRRELGLDDLKVEVVPMILAMDQNRISSTRIRAGEIDTEGNLLK